MKAKEPDWKAPVCRRGASVGIEGIAGNGGRAGLGNVPPAHG